jgi:hypothetical protein
MTKQSLNFLVPGIGPAGLPLPVTAQAEPEVEHIETQPDAAEIEHASWSPDAGAVEFDSWIANLRHAVQ